MSACLPIAALPKPFVVESSAPAPMAVLSKTSDIMIKRAIADGCVCATAFVGAQSVPLPIAVLAGAVDIVPERLVTNGGVPNPD